MNEKKKFISAKINLKAEGYDFEVVASTAAIDRHGESVDQSGWELDNYMANPVILWAHAYDELPIGRAEVVEVDERGLIIRGNFASEQANPKAQQVKTLYQEGILNTVSVGFIPKERNGNTITKAELLELSFVPVPANPEALRLALTKGFDKDFFDVKGVVADHLREQDVRDRKWDNWKEIWEIFDAASTVYFSDETDVDDFNKIIAEMVMLMSKFSGDSEAGTAVNEQLENSDEKENEARKKIYEMIFGKVGRVLSEKNRKLIEDSINTLKGSIAALEELLEATLEKGGEALQVESNKQPEVKVEKRDGAISYTISRDVLLDVRKQLRKNDQHNELVLSIVNSVLRQK